MGFQLDTLQLALLPSLWDIMPPLPLILDEETKSLIGNIQRRQTDLRDFQVPRLRDCKGPISVQQKLATELREDLTVFDDLIEVRRKTVSS